MLSALDEQSLSDLLGVVPLSVTPLSGGCIGDVFLVTLPPKHHFETDTDKVVLKYNPSQESASESRSGSLAIEGQMLAYLGENTTLPVPTVFSASATHLVMRWLPGESQFSPVAQQHAARLLAQLHQVTADAYGLDFDTLIGGLHQPNPKTASWLAFFRDQRLFYMAKAAYDEGVMPLEFLRRLDRFCDRLDRWLTEARQPALLHGDAWSNNILAEGDVITGFLDPAIYYGHPEIELAFTTLFSTFETPFFEAYEAISPLEDGFFEIRKDLYNLYPLTVHVRLFGQQYLDDVNRILKRVGC